MEKKPFVVSLFSALLLLFFRFVFTMLNILDVLFSYPLHLGINILFNVFNLGCCRKICFFFFFCWRHSPLWALACRTIPLHLSLSITNSLRHSQHLKISFHFFSPSFPGSSSSSLPFQFLSEDLFGHLILLHSLQVTQPTYPLPLYPFYYIFYFIQLF